MIPFLCRLANATGLDRLHRWGRPRKRRAAGFLVTRRRCVHCPATQEQQLPGGEWKTITPKPRTRLHPQTPAEETSRDRRRGLEPL